MLEQLESAVPSDYPYARLASLIESEGGTTETFEVLSDLLSRAPVEFPKGLMWCVVGDYLRERPEIEDLRAALDCFWRADVFLSPTENRQIWLRGRAAIGGLYSKLFRVSAYETNDEGVRLLTEAARAFDLALSAVSSTSESEEYGELERLRDWARDSAKKFASA
jgi:hypothetical protein